MHSFHCVEIFFCTILNTKHWHIHGLRFLKAKFSFHRLLQKWNVWFRCTPQCYNTQNHANNKSGSGRWDPHQHYSTVSRIPVSHDQGSNLLERNHRCFRILQSLWLAMYIGKYLVNVGERQYNCSDHDSTVYPHQISCHTVEVCALFKA